MKIIIYAIGKEKDFSGADIVREYTERISHYGACEWRYIAGESRELDNTKLVEAIMSEKEKSGAFIIALDEKGKEYDSPAFAGRIQSCMNESVRALIFVIGGSYGLDEETRKNAHITIALSKLTFPHQLVRLILAEQIYRAYTIIRGEKYHH